MHFPHQGIPQTEPVGAPQARRDRNIIVVLGVVVFLALIYIVVLHTQLGQLEDDSSKTIAAHLKTIALRTQQVEALDALATRIDAFNKEFGARVGRLQVDNIEGNVKNLEQKGHLPDDAKKTLDEFEKSAAEIQAMTDKMKEYERYLGAPVTAKRGQTHSDIARTYLIQEAKLAPQQADEVLRRTALDWEIEPGNQIFNLYHDGILLSTVTQGSARRAPMMVQWARRRAAQNKTQELEQKVKELEARLASVPAQPEGLSITTGGQK